MSEAGRKRRGASSEPWEGAFDSIPISAAFMPKSEAGSMECSLEVSAVVEGQHGAMDGVFLSEFAEKDLRQHSWRGVDSQT